MVRTADESTCFRNRPSPRRAASFVVGLAATILTAVAWSGMVRAERADAASITAADNDFAAVHDGAARALLAGRVDEALAGFNRAISLNPYGALAFYNRGRIYYLRRKLDLAIADFTRAIHLDPTFAFAHMNRGIALSNLGRLDEALRDLDEAIRLDGKNADALFNRAVVHVRRGTSNLAITDYEAAVARDAGGTDAEGARERLMKLLDRLGSRGMLATGETDRIAAEIEHARHVEHILKIVEQSCVRHGYSEGNLAAAANQQSWQRVSAAALRDASVPAARMVNGWSFSDRFGAYAIMQSVGTDDRKTPICSVTTQVGSSHLMNDVKVGFESRFDPERRGTHERPGQFTTRYHIKGLDTAGIDASLVYAEPSNALTMRFLFNDPYGAGQ